MEVMSDDKDVNNLWIHCMRCFSSYIRKTSTYYVTGCHHVFCDRCTQVKVSLNRNENNLIIKCIICKGDARGRQICNNLPPHIKELFHPTPYLEDLPFSRILNFQLLHREHLERGSTRIVRSKEKIETNLGLARNSGNNKFKTLENRKRERRKMENLVRQVIAKRKEMEADRKRRAESCKKYEAPPSTDESTVDAFSQSLRHRSPRKRKTKLSTSQPINILDMTTDATKPSSNITNSLFYKKNQSFTL